LPPVLVAYMLELLPFLRPHSASSTDESSFALREAIASNKVKRAIIATMLLFGTELWIKMMYLKFIMTIMPEATIRNFFSTTGLKLMSSLNEKLSINC
jgi:hypothetical protein